MGTDLPIGSLDGKRPHERPAAEQAAVTMSGAMLRLMNADIAVHGEAEARRRERRRNRFRKLLRDQSVRDGRPAFAPLSIEEHPALRKRLEAVRRPTHQIAMFVQLCAYQPYAMLREPARLEAKPRAKELGRIVNGLSRVDSRHRELVDDVLYPRPVAA